MATPGKFLLPSPNFGKKELPAITKPHYLSPSGMTCMQARDQPPPMYGKRGTTTPAKFLQQYNRKEHVVEAPVKRAYCEACDMELQSENDLRRHCAQHKSCPVEGCKYRGHASVMDKHVVSLHTSGLFEQFKKLSTPEEIAAWREERRRKYPTVANVLLRQRAQEQRQRRGERLEASKSRFGKHEDRQRAQAPNKSGANNAVQARREGGFRSKRHEKRVNRRRKAQEARKLTVENQQVDFGTTKESKDSVDEEQNSCCGVTMFKGTGQLKDYVHAKTKKQTGNALSSLLGMYGSDDDEEEEEEEEVLETTEKEEVDENNKILKQDTSLLVNDDEANNDTKENHETSMLEIGTSQTIDSLAIETGNTLNVSKVDDGCLFSASQPPAISPTYAVIVESEYQNTTNNQVNILHESTADVYSDDEAPEEAPIAHSSDLPLRADKSKMPADTGVNIVQPINANTNVEPIQKRMKCAPGKVVKRKSGLNYRKAYLRRQNTMLEKLLEPDIRHERNVLLQCVRFVCENKFFGIGQENKSTANSL